MLRRFLARIARALDLARLFELPSRHPDRMIAAQVVLYLGLGIIIVATLWSHWNVAHPARRRAPVPFERATVVSKRQHPEVIIAITMLDQ